MALVWLLIFLKDAIAQTITGTVTLSSSGSSTEYDLEFDLSIDLSYGILLYSLAIIFTMLLTDMVVKCNKRNRHDGGGYSIQYQVGQDDNYGGTGGGGGGGGAAGSQVPTHSEAGWDPVDCSCCPEALRFRAPICISMYTKCREGWKSFCLASLKRIIMLAVLVDFNWNDIFNKFCQN